MWIYTAVPEDGRTCSLVVEFLKLKWSVRPNVRAFLLFLHTVHAYSSTICVVRLISVLSRQLSLISHTCVGFFLVTDKHGTIVLARNTVIFLFVQCCLDANNSSFICVIKVYYWPA